MQETNIQKFDQFYNRLINNGEESDTAQEIAEERIRPRNEKAFFGKYTSLIDNYILPLRNNELHQKIMSQVDNLISKGYNTTPAVTKVIKNIRINFKIFLMLNLLMMKVKMKSVRIKVTQKNI